MHRPHSPSSLHPPRPHPPPSQQKKKKKTQEGISKSHPSVFHLHLLPSISLVLKSFLPPPSLPSPPPSTSIFHTIHHLYPLHLKRRGRCVSRWRSGKRWTSREEGVFLGRKRGGGVLVLWGCGGGGVCRVVIVLLGGGVGRVGDFI